MGAAAGKSRNMQATVFGASGFIGSHVVEELCKAGHGVNAVVRSPASRQLLEGFGARVMVVDYGDGAQIQAAMRGSDVVYNCIASTGTAAQAEDPEAEIGLTRRLAHTASALGVGHFVQLSSIVLYGFERSGAIDESYQPLIEYPIQRIQQRREEIVTLEVPGRQGMAVEAAGTALTILRPASVIGSRGERSFFANLYRLNQSGRFPIVGKGQARGSFIDARDLGRAMVFIGEHGISGTYLVKGFDASWSELKASMDEATGTHDACISIPAGLSDEGIDASPLNPYEYRSFATTRIWDDSTIREAGFRPHYSLGQAVRSEIGYLER